VNISAADKILVDPGQEDGARILVLVGDVDNFEVLLRFLNKNDYEFQLCLNDQDAAEIYKQFRPDIVLIDIITSDKVGFDTAKKIKNISGELFVPLVFLGSHYSDEELAKCIDSGGVGLLCEPYNDAVLKSKIITFRYLAELEKEKQSQQQEIELHRKQLESNYEIAIDVFNNVIHSDALDADAIRYSISPTSIFNGDILLAANRPSGEFQVMLGDFTGHGISAAIGTIPVADIFYGMTAKGFGISDIIVEINTKVKKILPRGLFLAACLFEYDLGSNKLSIWNAGLPDVLMYDETNREVKYQFSSRNYPMGVSDETSYTTTVENYFIKDGDRLVLFTDGIVEARNPDGVMYGLEGVVDGVKNIKTESVVDLLLDNMAEFTHGIKQSDDATVLEVDFKRLQVPVESVKKNNTCVHILNSNWAIDYTFEPTILKVYDPLPNIIQMIMEVQKLRCHKQNVFIIIKELFVNALDHGLLGLSSEIKSDEDGFSKYVLERQKRLESLSEGEISVSIKHTGNNNGGILDVYIKDTGKGFDTNLVSKLLVKDSGYYGRGIFMVNAICESLNYSDNGRQVHASYKWTV